MTKRSNSVNFPDMGVKSNNQPLMLIDSKRRNYRARDFPSYLSMTVVRHEHIYRTYDFNYYRISKMLKNEFLVSTTTGHTTLYCAQVYTLGTGNSQRTSVPT